MKRRAFVQGLASVLGATAVGCTPDAPDMAAPPSASMPPFSEERLHDSLEALRSAYEAKSHHVSPSLLPGLSESELRRRCAWFPQILPEELVALYGWRGGQAGNPWEEPFPFWFRDCAFASPERAREAYELLTKSWGWNPGHRRLFAAAFPFAEFDGAWLVLPCGDEGFAGFARPVVSIHEEIAVWFYSISAMVDTCADWVAQPAWSEGGLPREVELEIWRRHNPGIFPGAS